MKIKQPWLGCFKSAKDRCNNPNCKDYYRYGGRGIKFLLSKKETQEIWFRDKGWLLEIPSIDRIDNDGDYCFENCQFIEKNLNAKKGSKSTVK